MTTCIRDEEGKESVHPDFHPDSHDAYWFTYGFPAYWFTYRPLSLELTVKPLLTDDNIPIYPGEEYICGLSSSDVLYDLLDFAGEWR
jgi:hypothetical protein